MVNNKMNFQKYSKVAFKNLDCKLTWLVIVLKRQFFIKFFNLIRLEL